MIARFEDPFSLPSIGIPPIETSTARRHWRANDTRVSRGKGIKINTITGQDRIRHIENESIAVEVTDRDAQKHWQDYEVRC